MTRHGRTIENALAELRPLIAHDGDIDHTIANLADHRGRPICITEEDAAPGGPSGTYVRYADHDEMIVKRGSPPTRRTMILCHEIGHLMLGHRGQHTREEIAAAVAPDVPDALAARFLNRHGYDDDQERAAETFATLLLVELTRRRPHPDMVTARLR